MPSANGWGDATAGSIHSLEIDMQNELCRFGILGTAAIARKIIDAFLSTPATPTPAPAVEDAGLGTREQQVLQQVINGLSQKEIAKHLGISISTVNTYIQRIYEKLHVHSRAQATALYAQLKPNVVRPPGK